MSPMPVGVIRSSARMTPMKPRPRRAAGRRRSPGSPIGRMILAIRLQTRAEERAAHLDQRRRRVAHRIQRVQHDHRHRHDADGQHLGGEADAVGEGDQRDQRRQRRRLRDDEDRRDQPFGEAVRAPSARRARRPQMTETTRPMTSGSSVMSEGLDQASRRGSSRRSAAMVSRKVGKAGLIGMRPAYSQAAAARSRRTSA